ncbi:MAG: helix-turn-helix domain-containing protein [Nitrososphaerales archaeon]
MGPKELSRAARVSQPRVYDTLRSLEEKGFIEQAGERYVAAAPRTALKGRSVQFKTLFEEEQKQREEAEKLLRLLEPLHLKKDRSF